CRAENENHWAKVICAAWTLGRAWKVMSDESKVMSDERLAVWRSENRVTDGIPRTPNRKLRSRVRIPPKCTLITLYFSLPSLRAAQPRPRRQIRLAGKCAGR